MTNANSNTTPSSSDDLLFILHAAQAADLEGVNDETRSYFLNEIVATTVRMLDANKHRALENGKQTVATH